jgi:hypothetical protein
MGASAPIGEPLEDPVAAPDAVAAALAGPQVARGAIDAAAGKPR